MPIRTQFENDADFMKALRDWFAGQALAGLISDPNERASHAAFANESYRLADAMIAARGGK